MVLIVLFLLAFVGAILAGLLAANVDFTSRERAILSAECLARSGLDYAAYHLSSGDWLDKERPFELTRQLGGGRIELRVTDVDSRTVLVESIGEEESGRRCKLAMSVGRPDVMTDYLLCVLNYDYERSQIRTGSVVRIGADNVGASSVSAEMHTVPSDGIVVSGAPGDPQYAGIVPGTTYVIDDSGCELELEAVRPHTAGYYSMDTNSGTFVFHPSDAGRRVCLFYDYFRRVPVAPNPFTVSLPSAPVKPDTEHVWGLDGTPFWRSYVAPVAQGNYFIDYDYGRVDVSEFDSGRAIRVGYAFLGSRHTGPVHVNGDIEWHKTNQCLLSTGRGDRISVSGRFRYAPGAMVSIWTEENFAPDARLSKEIEPFYRQGQPMVEPAPVNLDWLRRQANPKRGGSGWYLSNSGDVEALPVQSPATYTERQVALFSLWQSRQGAHWANGRFEPPGAMVDLSKLPPGEPANGLIFAEGNIHVFGRIPRGRRLTLVSANNIYVDGSIWKKDRNSSLALVADNNICFNLTKLEEAVNADGVVEFYINALLCARRGTLAVIPGSARDCRAIIYGAICINSTYDNIEWGKAFSSIDYVFDSSFRSSSTRPPYLASVLQSEAQSVK